MNEKVLVVAAHPDDEVLGCGGTIAKLTHDGVPVRVLLLCKSGRGGFENAFKAAKILGVRVLFEDFPGNKFDTVPLLSIVNAISVVADEFEPSIVFTHSKADLTVDHKVCCEAVVAAVRPFGLHAGTSIFCFETVSSTEWNSLKTFKPNHYEDITGFWDKKLKALKAYESEMRPFPHPRSYEGLKALAKFRGMNVGFEAAEAFEIARDCRSVCK